MQELKDTQSEPDHRNNAIDRVGVRELRFPVEIEDKAKQVQGTVATVSMAVDLPHHYKGTHMSRFVEVLNAHGPRLSVRDMSAIPGELLHVFDTGFHLYECGIHAATGNVALGSQQEVRGWYWLSLEEFGEVEWRYAGQGEVLYRLLTGATEVN